MLSKQNTPLSIILGIANSTLNAQTELFESYYSINI